MHNIQVGTKREVRLLVTSQEAIDFLGLESARVLSTPHLIGYMERTSRDTVLPSLEPGYDTVGTKVNITHLAAAPIGSVVTFTSEITVVQDRRVEFHVAARTEDELIGEGTHERAIINVAKFATRLAAKSQRK
jgi:fluoroacetyl-CoA thioesterase